MSPIQFRSLRLLPLVALFATSTASVGTSQGSLSAQPRGFIPLEEGDAREYQATINGGRIYIRPNGWILAQLETKSASEEEFHYATEGIGFEFVGANADARLQPQDPNDVALNYFVGSEKDWRTDVATFGQVHSQDVYEGVDVHYRLAKTGFEYDLVLETPSAASEIQIRVHGASVELLEDGSLMRVHAGLGEIDQIVPAAWQVQKDGSKTPIEAHFVLLDEGSFGLAIDAADPSLETVIDPLIYSTLIGGGNWDSVWQVDENEIGVLTIAGHTAMDTPHGAVSPIQFPSTGASLSPTHQGSALFGQTGWSWPLTDGHRIDSFVARIDPNRPVATQLRASTFIGSRGGNEYIRALHVERNSEVVTLGGYVASPNFNFYADFPITANAHQPNYVGGSLTFTLLPGAPLPVPMISPFNRWFASEGGFVMQLVLGLPGQNSLRYCSFLSGPGQDRVEEVVYSEQRFITVSGRTTSASLPIFGNGNAPTPLQATHSRGPGPNPNGFTDHDGFIVRFDLGPLPHTQPATVDFGTFLGGNSFDAISHMVLRDNGDIVFGGFTASLDLPLAQPIQAFNNSVFSPGLFSATDVWVGVVKPRGFTLPGLSSMTLDFSTYFGGFDLDILEGLDFDERTGDMWFSGNTRSVAGSPGLIDYRTSPNSFMPTPGATVSACGLPVQYGFVTRLRPGSVANAVIPQLRWSTLFGGNNDTIATFMNAQESGSCTVGGWTYATDFPVPTWGDDTIYGQNGDLGQGTQNPCAGNAAAEGFIMRFDLDGAEVMNGTFVGAAEDDFIFHGMADEKGGVAVGGMTLNSGFDYVRNGVGDAIGTIAQPNDVFPTSPNAFSSTYTLPQFKVARHFADPATVISPFAAAPVVNNPAGTLEEGVYNAGEGFVSKISLPALGVQRAFETSATFGCLGRPVIDVNRIPRAGSSTFAITCSDAPPSATGVLFFGLTAAAPIPVPSPVNVDVLIDPVFVTIPATSDANGYAEVPISLNGATPGNNFSVQFIWVSAIGCTGNPVGTFDVSGALEVTVQLP